MASRSISVIVPVYNGAGTLHQLSSRLASVMDSMAGAYELILVDDGSRDQSWRVIQELSAKDARIRGINLMRNYGQHNALLCGIRIARHELIVTMDDDLQNPPEEIPKLLQKIEEGADVVYGRPASEQHTLWRDLASQITKLALQDAMGVETARQVSAYRAFYTRLRDAFAVFQGSFVSIDTLLTWGASRFDSVVVKHDPRRIGTSNYTFTKLLAHAINMMTGFTVIPLQVATLMGFGLTLFGISVLAFVLVRYVLQGTTVPGFPFLASIIAIFSGAQLFALGVIGEYLARMHFRLMDRPPYAIRASTPQAINQIGPGAEV